MHGCALFERDHWLRAVVRLDDGSEAVGAVDVEHDVEHDRSPDLAPTVDGRGVPLDVSRVAVWDLRATCLAAMVDQT